MGALSLLGLQFGDASGRDSKANSPILRNSTCHASGRTHKACWTLHAGKVFTAPCRLCLDGTSTRMQLRRQLPFPRRPQMSDVTQLLNAVSRGEGQAAEQLLPLVYEELRRLAKAYLDGERPGQTLQPTALVHEAFIRLVRKNVDAQWQGRKHFLATAALAMRHILIDNARRKKREKRGGDGKLAPLVDGADPRQQEADRLLALDEALTRLAAADAQALVQGARLLAQSADGLMPWKGRPEALKRGLIARVPPFDFSEQSE